MVKANMSAAARIAGDRRTKLPAVASHNFAFERID